MTQFENSLESSFWIIYIPCYLFKSISFKSLHNFLSKEVTKIRSLLREFLFNKITWCCRKPYLHVTYQKSEIKQEHKGHKSTRALCIRRNSLIVRNFQQNCSSCSFQRKYAWDRYYDLLKKRQHTKKRYLQFKLTQLFQHVNKQRLRFMIE